MEPRTLADSPLPERYTSEEQIGVGGMGRVLRALDRKTGTTVAVKILRDELTSPAAKQRFCREGATLAELRHPGIVAHLDHGVTDDGSPYLVMEWVQGESLEHRLERGPLEEAELLALLRETAAALAVAHRRGIVHRDLKPSNLLLRDNRLDQAVLIDFGVARYHASESQLTKTGAVIGTPEYMSPEQARGERELPLSVDIFALGCIAYRCLGTRSPFAADRVASVLARILFEDLPAIASTYPHIRPEFAALIERMLSRDPAHRPSDADALYGELLTIGSSSEADLPTLIRDVPTRAKIEHQLLTVLSAARCDVDEESPGLDDPTRIPHKLGGRIIEQSEDRFLVAFSLGNSAADRATVAARCALALRHGWPQFRFAIATGRGLERAGSTRGEVVDAASALLELVGHTGSISLDTLTSDLLDGRFEIVDVDTRYRLVGESPHDADPRHLLGKPIPCLGRAHELGVLDLTLESAIEDRQAQLVIVSGDAGRGKSRLRHEFLRRRSKVDEELTILHGEGDPMSAGSPYALIGQAFRRVAGIEPDQSLQTKHAKLDALIDRWPAGDDRAAALEFLAELIGLPHPDDPCPAFRAALDDPGLMRERCLQTGVALLHSALAQQPVLLVAEDLHWADQLTVDLLLLAHSELADHPLMILCLTRPEAFERYPQLANSGSQDLDRQLIRLSGLSRRTCARLIHMALQGSLEVSDTLVERLIEHAAGNALYLEELIRAAATHDFTEFPTTVGAMLQARMEQLDDDARHTLLVASVYGPSFDLPSIARALEGVDSAALRQALERLVGSEMIEATPDGRQYRFQHALVRDAAYRLLSPEGARQTHIAAADYLIARGEDPMTIAEHLARGGRGERAATYYLRAADQARAANSSAEALRRAELGLACQPTKEVAHFLDAIRVWAYSFLGRWNECLSLAEQTLPKLEPGSQWWCRCVSGALGVSVLLGQEEFLDVWTTHFLAAQPATDSLVSFVDGANIVIGCATSIGRYRLAERYFRRATQVARATPKPPEDVRRLLAFGEASLAFYVDLNIPAALAAAEAAARLSRAVGDNRYTVFSQYFVSFCHYRLGEPEAAIATARAARAVVVPLANPYLDTYSSVALAETLIRTDDSSESLSEATSLTASVLAAPNSPVPYPSWARIISARASLSRGQTKHALTEARAALRGLTGAPALQCSAWLTLAEGHHTFGQLDDALDAAEAALDVIEQERGWEYLETLLVCARLRREAGDHGGARAAEAELAAGRESILAHIDDPAARERVAAALTLAEA
jgi:serine/threonine protein kinase/tetratricopeptide (TPR) repeat protein